MDRYSSGCTYSALYAWAQMDHEEVSSPTASGNLVQSARAAIRHHVHFMRTFECCVVMK